MQKMPDPSSGIDLIWTTVTPAGEQPKPEASFADSHAVGPKMCHLMQSLSSEFQVGKEKQRTLEKQNT